MIFKKKKSCFGTEEYLPTSHICIKCDEWRECGLAILKDDLKSSQLYDKIYRNIKKRRLK